MSIAVAVRKDGQTVVAADTQTNFGDAKVPVDNHRSAKILRVGPSYVATTGWGIYENLLQDYLARRTPPRLADQGEIFDFFLRFWK
jgi:ATP-dependent protease HslVU (ClpYQ) peptidase subunit